MNQVIQLAGGWRSVCDLNVSHTGRVWCWGHGGDDGELGVGDGTQTVRLVPSR